MFNYLPNIDVATTNEIDLAITTSTKQIFGL